MKLKLKIASTLLLLAFCLFSYGQLADYQYQRKLNGVSEQWHQVILPNVIFGKTLDDLVDIRFFGITEENDTIEAPYLLKLTTKKESRKDIAFNTLNTSHKANKHYFTFEIPNTESINQIQLDFKQENFDWQITLEGSQNQNEWFTVLEDYRIISIKNDLTNFQFTNLSFPNSKYRYFRLVINSAEKPELNLASIAQNEITEGRFRKYPIKKIQTQENKQNKHTEIEIDLGIPSRISSIKIAVLDSFDFYRPLTIKYLTDSFKTEQGWKYNYSVLARGTLNSIGKNEFQFSSTTVQKLKIFIANSDNQALRIDTIEIKGCLHKLMARFTEKATYFLCYGNKKANQPNYDIHRFTKNIPETMTTLELGKELKIEKEELPPAESLFENKTWLWIIMALIIGTLGLFSVKMISKK